MHHTREYMAQALDAGTLPPGTTGLTAVCI